MVLVEAGPAEPDPVNPIRVGWGECPTLPEPGYLPISTDDVWAWLRAQGPTMPAWDSEDPRTAAGQLSAAVRDARWDRRAREAGESAIDSLVAVPPRSLEVDTTTVIGLAPSLDTLVERVEAASAEGARHVKIKITPGWCVEPLRTLRALWPDLDLAADANGSFGPDDLELLHRLGDLGVRYVEQPMAPERWRRFPHREWPVAAPLVALDESVCTPADVAWLLATPEAAALVNVKGPRLGGVQAGLAVAGRLRAAGIGCFVGGMLETGVGRAAALTLAVAVAGDAPHPTDLGPSSRYFATDLTPPIEPVRPGVLALPAGPGFGPAPDPGRLAGATVDRIVRSTETP